MIHTERYISFIPLSFTRNVNLMLDLLDPTSYCCDGIYDVHYYHMLVSSILNRERYKHRLGYFTKSWVAKITRPNSIFHLSINIKPTLLLSFLILQHLHTQRYGLLIDEVVVIYKHLVWFTYSRSSLHTLQLSAMILDGLVSCIHPCKVLSSIHRTIKCLTSSLARQSTSSLVYHTIYRSSEVEHILCTKDTARLLTYFDFVWFHMPCAHTQSSQTRPSPLSGDTFLPGKCHTNYTSSCDQILRGRRVKLTLCNLYCNFKFWLRFLQNKHTFKPHHIHISLILQPVSVEIT